MAELWGVLEGLCFTWRLGYRAVELEVDSTSVVKVIRAGVITSVMGVALLEGIGRLLELDWEVKLAHAYREANTCADALANIGCSLGTDTTFFEECPSQISHLLSTDQMGLLSPRLISL
ncbi:non-LTR retroelement reverse transcriptase-like [Trifolium medium]|uniref:Non-LTR retroelement reverse transcriptase-like n=1 Tax=Trifolium medium TaxID=97028 RepID=A0A392NMB6_9FABA|nr:non-LTR retroelement reverse transcriptase-like [Trifolium medium]